MTKTTKLFTIPAIFALLSTAFSCKEGERDYTYTLKNNSSFDVNIEYSIAGDDKKNRDTISPGAEITICERNDVSGKDIWNIETGADIYMLSKLEANVNDSIFSESLCNRKLWNGPEEQNGKGIYYITLSDTMFCKSYKNYYYIVENNAQKGLLFSVKINGINTLLQVPGGGKQAIGPFKNLARYTTDIYEKSNRLTQLTISNMNYYADADTVEINGFNPNSTSNWTFSKDTLFSDSIGIYTMIITDEILTPSEE